MWGAPIHNKEFVKEMLDHVEENSNDFKTSERIKGMLTVAYNVSPSFFSTPKTTMGQRLTWRRFAMAQECDAPLYFSPARMASYFNALCPPLHTMA